jgi:hypothetical protein
MKVFSASQAVSPAIDRTKRYLFHPFKWSTYLKLAAVACITEGFSANLNFSSNQPSYSSAGASTPFNLSSEAITLIAFAVLACVALCIFIFYLVSRLRFAFFHCLAHQTKEIRPAWRLYRAQALRYFKANLVVGIIFLCILLLAALPFAFKFYGLYRSSRSGGQFDVVRFILLLLPFIGIVVFISLAACIVEVVLHDFILPRMALENLSCLQAWDEVKLCIKAEKGSFALYFFLRLVLPVLAMMALFIVAAIPLLIVFGILALTEVGFDALLADATGVGAVFRVFIEILFGLIDLGLGLFVAFSLGGPIATWIRNYALLFYGGRYPVLGDILSPPPPTAPAAPEVP